MTQVLKCENIIMVEKHFDSITKRIKLGPYKVKYSYASVTIPLECRLDSGKCVRCVYSCIRALRLQWPLELYRG